MLFSYCGKWTQLRRTRTDISVPYYHFLSFTTCSVFSLSYSHCWDDLDISPSYWTYHLTILPSDILNISPSYHHHSHFEFAFRIVQNCAKTKFFSDPHSLKMQPAGLVQKMSKMWFFYTDFTQRFCTDSEFFKRRHSLGLVVCFFIKRTFVKFGWNRTLVLVVCFVPSNTFRLQTLVWLQLVVCEPIAPKL